MDGHDNRRGIEHNRQALLVIVAALVTMAGQCAGTLPRRFHRTVLRLLRPAEYAARRLVIAFARDLVPPARPRSPKPPAVPPRHAVVIVPWQARQALREAAAAKRPAAKPRRLTLPLFDPPVRRARPQPTRLGTPRISAPGATALSPIALRPPPQPGDPLDATRLTLRIAALKAALDDLPRHALRFARWREAGKAAAATPAPARPARRRTRRIWPLRMGRLPGAGARETREAHGILKTTHGLAIGALETPDSS